MTESKSNKPGGADGSLRAALHRARSDQADHFDAVEEVRLAETARLQALADELYPVVQSLPDDNEQVQCVVVPGNPPRLWIDMLAYVAMGEDGRTYRLLQTTTAGRITLYETLDRNEMAGQVTDYIAHRLIDREREAEARLAQVFNRPEGGYSGIALLLAWICGFSVGVLTLFVIGAIIAGGAGV